MEISNLQATFSATTRDFERGVARVQRGISDTESRLNRAGRSAQSFWSNMASNTLANLATNLLGRVANAVQSLITGSIKSAASLEAMERGLTAITGSASEAQAQLVRLREIAKMPGLRFAEAVQGSLALQAVGFSAAKAERTIKAFGNALALTPNASRSTSDALQTVFTQLTQMSSKGKILTQDLRPILETGPLVGMALKKAFGTVNAADIEKMGLTYDQFFEKLLTQLELLPSASGGAKNALENFSDSFEQALATIGKPLLEPLTRAIEAIVPIMTSAAQGIADFFRGIPQLATDLWAALPESYKTGLATVLGIVQSIGAQIVGWFTENMPLIRQTVTTILGAIGDFWTTWGGTIKNIVSTAMNAVLAVIKIVMQAINGDWKGAWETLRKAAVTILESLPDIIKSVISFAVQAVGLLLKAIAKAILAGLEAFPEMLRTVLLAALKAIGSVAQYCYVEGVKLGGKIADGIIAGIASHEGIIARAIKSMIGGGAIDVAKDKLEAKSPSMVFYRFGRAIAQGLAIGIESGIGLVGQSMEKLLDAAIKKFSPKMTAKKTAQELKDSVLDALTKQADVLRELGGSDSALATINRLLADPAVARIVDRRTASLLRFNATLEDTLKLTRERVVGLPDWMRATGEETRERAVGLPDWMRSTGEEGRLRTGAGVPPGQRAGDETRERRVLPDLVAEARLRAGQIADDLTGIIGGAFDRLLDHGWRGFLQGMLDSAKRIFSQIADELINQLLRGAMGANQQGKAGGLIGMIMGLVGSAVGGAFGGGGTGGVVSALDASFANVPLIAGFAQGGFLPPGKWGIAGEEGPEPIFGGIGGMTVVPNGAGGTIKNIYNLNFQSKAQNSFNPLRAESEGAQGLMNFLRKRLK